jgi:uncharacterized 2Fe-2S/4Fe-4S cluster protein (DUF4445 family)
VSLTIQAGSEHRSVAVGLPIGLTDAAERAGIALNTRCAGQGACGGCAVQLGAGSYRVGGRDIHISPGETRSALACQTEVLSDPASVVFPSTSLLEKTAIIDEDFLLGPVADRPAFHVFHVSGITERTLPSLPLETALIEALEPVCGRQIAPLAPPVLIQLARLAEREHPNYAASGLFRDGRFLVLDLSASEMPGDALGVAVDIGTTTVVALLMDLRSGRILSKASMYNQQIRKADDVASRISACRTAEDETELQRLILQDTVNPLLSAVCAQAGSRDPHRIFDIVFSGNTVMSHLLLGLPPAGIGRLPFRPVQTRYPEREAGSLGLQAAPHARVRVVPSVSGYIGGDITSDLHVTGMHGKGETCLLIDIGTNGEMALRAHDQLSACATAAGPAFEGYGLRHGCRASAGAIEHMEFGADLNFKFRVIGNQPPIGFCGSALIDFIACGYRSGLLNSMGRMDIARLKAAHRYLRDPALTGDSDACILVREKESGLSMPLTLSERDIASVLNAKAAIYAGLTTLLEACGMTARDVQRVYLAGGFARHINLRNAVTMGLLPELPLERYTIVGNGSLAGAYLALVDTGAWEAYDQIASRPRIIELNRMASFESHFIDALGLPNLDPSAFPGEARSSGPLPV